MSVLARSGCAARDSKQWVRSPRLCGRIWRPRLGRPWDAGTAWRLEKRLRRCRWHPTGRGNL